MDAIDSGGQAAFCAACTQRQFGPLTVDDERLAHAAVMLDELWSHLAGDRELSSQELLSRSHYALAYMYELGETQDVEDPLASLAMSYQTAADDPDADRILPASCAIELVSMHVPDPNFPPG